MVNCIYIYIVPTYMYYVWGKGTYVYNDHKVFTPLIGYPMALYLTLYREDLWGRYYNYTYSI